VFIFTTALFLCGYVVQQKTVNDIREAIKPQPRPVHTNLYVPPKPGATPAVAPQGEDGVQIIEVVNERQTTEVAVEESTNEITLQQVTEAEEEKGLVQGADGGFLRKQSQRPRKRRGLLDKILAADPRRDISEEATRNGILDPRKSAEASGGSTPDSKAKLSRAARRKLIKDEFVKLAGEDLLNNPNTYKKRRLW
jgi:hypothetical protein